MSIEEKITNDIKKAMKEKDVTAISALRMLKASIEELFIQKKRTQLKDEDIIKLVKTMVRRHNDSIEQFTKGKRPDLVEKEKAQLKIIKRYVPEELPAEELKKMINEAISETGATSKKDMGKVMKLVLEKAKGKADGKTVSQIVGSLLR